MGERDDARRQVEQKREHMSRIAYEVSRRMTPRYAKERARDMARERMSRVRERAVESSWFAPLLGAAAGVLVAKTLQSRAQQRGWGRDRYYGYEARAYGYPRYGYAAEEEFDEYGAAAMREEPRAGAEEGAGSRLREKASEVKERARDTAEQAKERLQEATSSVRERLPDRERIRESAYEDAGLWALGAAALGALFGLALPESAREREMLAPARRRARELAEEAKETVARKGSELMDKASEKVGTTGAAQPGSAAGGPPPPGPAPLH